MKKLLTVIFCFFFPKKLIGFLVKHKYSKQHHYPPSTLIHRRKAKVLYEIEFNWYDQDMLPVSIVREVKSGKTFSVNYHEMYDFKEYAGTDVTAGSSLDGYGKEK